MIADCGLKHVGTADFSRGQNLSPDILRTWRSSISSRTTHSHTAEDVAPVSPKASTTRLLQVSRSSDFKATSVLLSPKALAHQNCSGGSGLESSRLGFRSGLLLTARWQRLLRTTQRWGRAARCTRGAGQQQPSWRGLCKAFH